MKLKRHLDSVLLIGKEAVRNNAIPAALLWLAASLVVAGYYFQADVRGFFDSIGELKARYGFLFSMCSTAICGGLLPFLCQYLKPKVERTMGGHELLFFVVLWGLKGIEVDAVYRLQVILFGSGNDFITVVTKVLVDMLIYVPSWGVPVVVLAILWKDCSYSLNRTIQALHEKGAVERIVPIIILNWFVWFPTAFAIYVMPPSLQIVMQNIVLCFFVLLLTFFTKKEQSPS